MRVRPTQERVAMPRAATSGRFETFYEAHWTATVAVTAALCGDLAIAEELAQEAFLRAYGRWDHVSRLDRPELWIRRVALNLAVSRFRRLQTETRALLRLRARRRAASEQPFEPEVEEFWGALRSLPARQAQVAALFYVDDLSIADIAEVLSCAEGTVKAHLHGARQRLRSSLSPDREAADEAAQEGRS